MSRGGARTLSLDTSYEAVPESVGHARRALAALAALGGASEEDLERIRLAVSEAVSNAVIHAYGHGGTGTGTVTLTAAVIDAELTVIVADDGCGFGGAPESQGLGIGLAVIAQLCDSLSMIARSSGGTQMEMPISAGSCTGRRRGARPPRQAPGAPGYLRGHPGCSPCIHALSGVAAPWSARLNSVCRGLEVGPGSR